MLVYGVFMEAYQHDKTGSTPQEIAKFEALAQEWWDRGGKFKPLHKFNPVRLRYIRDQICRHFDYDKAAFVPFKGLRLLDIGCGGGLLCEPMARLGANVTGVDIGAANIEAAQIHATTQDLPITYRCATAESLKEEKGRFDVILNMEVVEHVAHPTDFIAACADLLTPNGIMIMATLNRTRKSYALAIIGAEYILRWLPRGTHDWHHFITPQELESMLAAAHCALTQSTGVSFNPLLGQWQITGDLSVNYMGVAQKQI